MEKMKPCWTQLKNTVVLTAASFEDARVEYGQLIELFPNNSLYESGGDYGSDDCTELFFWRQHTA
jgi:hypothetical protein